MFLVPLLVGLCHVCVAVTVVGIDLSTFAVKVSFLKSGSKAIESLSDRGSEREFIVAVGLRGDDFSFSHDAVALSKRCPECVGFNFVEQVLAGNQEAKSGIIFSKEDLSYHQLLSLFLTYIKDVLVTTVEEEPSFCAISVSAQLPLSSSLGIISAAKSAGFTSSEVIPDLFAAGVQYSIFNRGDTAPVSGTILDIGEHSMKVCDFDMVPKTSNFPLRLSFSKYGSTVNFLSGASASQTIKDLIIKKLGAPKSDLPFISSFLGAKMSAYKKTLNSNGKVSVSVELADNDYYQSLSLSEVHSLLEQQRELTTNWLKANVDAKRRLLITGGHSRSVLIQDSLKACEFQFANLPDDCIAKGAAFYAAVKSPSMMTLPIDTNPFTFANFKIVDGDKKALFELQRMIFEKCLTVDLGTSAPSQVDMVIPSVGLAWSVDGISIPVETVTSAPANDTASTTGEASPPKGTAVTLTVCRNDLGVFTPLSISAGKATTKLLLRGLSENILSGSQESKAVSSVLSKFRDIQSLRRVLSAFKNEVESFEIFLAGTELPLDIRSKFEKDVEDLGDCKDIVNCSEKLAKVKSLSAKLKSGLSNAQSLKELASQVSPMPDGLKPALETPFLSDQDLLGALELLKPKDTSNITSVPAESPTENNAGEHQEL